jgi:hypothetical protein
MDDEANPNGGVDASFRIQKPLSTTSYPSNSLQFLQKGRSRITFQNDTKGTPPRQAKVRLKVLIVGAGLGGLATSIALARRGHSVTVLEQAQQLGEVSHFCAKPNVISTNSTSAGRSRRPDPTQFQPPTRTMGSHFIPSHEGRRTRRDDISQMTEWQSDRVHKVNS